ncbi:response regulator transcription factor [Salinispira pacifica]|uniref:Two-component response regulator n=1 Tax=Salinispira pacifica TaxID=1307761 RepID=V5WIS4_9SPIO|nr:response regulator [Salinispira pacifica]AHC15742.1 two-component response regulator [Salinispira pacifica]
MSETVKVFIVDDEQPVLEGVQRVLEDNSGPYRLVGSALNGSTALDQIPGVKPDIILMDINMPGINGLEVIRQLNAAGVQAVSILITAYERFDIAREAFGLGIFSYLLKPVTPQKLITALDEARTEVVKRQSHHRSVLQAREDLQESRKLMEWSFVNQLTRGMLSDDMIEEFLPRLGIDAGTRFVPLLLDFPEAFSGNAHELITQLGYQLPLLSGSLIHRRRLWTLIKGEHSTASVRNALKKAEQRLTVSPFQAPGDAARGISCSVYPAADAFHIPELLAESSRTAVFSITQGEGQAGNTEVGTAAKTVAGKDASSGDTRSRQWAAGELAVALERLLIRGAVYDARDLIFSSPYTGVSQRCLSAGSEDVERAFIFLQRILALLYSREETEVTDAWLGTEIEDIPGDVAALDDAVIREFRRIARMYSRKMDSNPLIRQVLLYIDENFQRQFSLEEAALHCNVSPQHLSRSFSSHMGISFVDYLTQMRVQEGIRLMKQGKQNISEVARLCGYSDPNYFSRIFKKVHGSTPSAFIQSLQGETH